MRLSRAWALDRDRKNPRHVRGRDGGGSPVGPYAIVAKGSEEILGHESVVAELCGVLIKNDSDSFSDIALLINNLI